ncbi:MAG: hypothetical protein P8X87_05075 [Candidatus Bathyarchaeota archaeon]
MKVELSEETKTLFKFDLPFAIPVPDDVYPIRIGSELGKVSIKQKTKDSKADKKSLSEQTKYDKYGVCSYSSLKVLVPKKMNMIEEGRKSVLIAPEMKRLKAQETVVRIVNRFIETAKHVTSEYWIEPIRYNDILDLKAYFLDGGKKYSVKVPKLKSKKKVSEAQVDEQKVKKEIKDALSVDYKFDLSKSFLLDAKDSCSKEDYIRATIEAASALEVALYQTILDQGNKSGVRRNDLKRMIKTIKSTGDISAALKMLSNGTKELDAEAIKDCKGTLTVRNNILQKGARNVYSTDTEKRVTAIETMVNWLQLMSSQGNFS